MMMPMQDPAVLVILIFYETA